MKSRTLVLLVLGVVLIAGLAGAKGLDYAGLYTQVPMPNAPVTSSDLRGARLETLWIFEADFEDLVGDNAGWTSPDLSGTAAQVNYWHKDTIRLTETYLGDSTWWCGTYNECWLQPRGYGNDWLVMMHNDLALSSWSVDGDDVFLEFDQRFALEHDYDYGYVDISDDGGSTWTSIYTVNNPGFAGKPGTPKDWDDPTWGHPSLNLSAWAGTDIRLRLRVETDEAYSAQNEYNNPPLNSVQDGAWQLDNFDLTVNTVTVWSDDAESPGDNGWNHDDQEAASQTGLVFRRGLYGTDFDTGRPFTCENRVGWMMGATDLFTDKMIDGQYTWLISPPIDISDAEKLVGFWDMWVDLPFETNDRFDLWLASNDQEQCVTQTAGFQDENPGGWYGGPFWGTWADDWDAFAGNDWLAIAWQLQNDEPAAPGSEHMAGILLHRQKVGIPSGDPGTAFTYGNWDRFNDWYIEEMADALLDSAEITVKDDDDVETLYVMATNDDGATWSSYSCRRLDPLGNQWICPPPVNEMTARSEIHYYFEAADTLGNIAVYPNDAPDTYFEFSILPIAATVSDPGLLLVDKHKRLTPSEQRDYAHTSEYYYREALGILGYEWEVFDVEVESGTAQSEGPDSAGYKYYDTILWFTNQFDSFTFWPEDQQNVINWLAQAPTKERNFIVTGNDWAFDMMEANNETLDFVTQWLAVDYVQGGLGTPPADTLPILKDNPGGYTFMDNDDGECILRGGCPQIEYFDVIDAQAGVTGAEVMCLYEKEDASEFTAGVAYTHPTFGYQTVALGFGVEFMMDSLDPSTGYYNTGVEDRVNLMDNVMTYLAWTPDGDPTGVVDNGFKNMLAHAQPNPFNPVTKIAYSIREAGPATIEVYNIAGKVVRTLLDSELDAGTTGFVVWDGSDDMGAKCASGVYFYRMTAPNFTESHKMVMLK